MWRSIGIAAAVGTAIVGVGAAALAETGSPSPGGTSTQPSPSTTAQPKHHAKQFAARGKNFEHGEWVTDKNGQNVTHAAIQGSVTAVNGSSITVKATDATSWTFTVTNSTKVFERENGKGSGKQGAIGDVKTNDHVVVIGSSTNASRTAERVLDLGTK